MYTKNAVYFCLSVLILTLFLTGCLPNPAKKLANPAPIHQDQRDDKTAISDETAKKAYNAYVDHALIYYKAMEESRAEPNNQNKIDVYLRSGITLVDVSCRHWFKNLAEAQRNIELAQENTNILYQLGTALIGIGKLHSDVTASYGALTAGYLGYTKNIDTSFLVAPNAENVKQLTFDALKSRKEKLMGDDKPANYDDAYNALDAYADICTYPEIKRLTNGAISVSQTSDENGRIVVVPKTIDGLKGQAGSLFDPVKSLLSSVNQMNFSQAIALTSIMPFQKDPRVAPSISRMDPDNKRYSDISVAKIIIKMAITGTATTDSEIKKWQDAIKKVQ